jgi:hypothetical protein
MGDHHIYPSEALWLILWLSAPILLLSWIVLVVAFIRRGVFRRGHTVRALAGVSCSTIAILVLGVAFWLVFPQVRLGSAPLLPGGGWLGLVPPLFLPALIVALVIVPITIHWVTNV